MKYILFQYGQELVPVIFNWAPSHREVSQIITQVVETVLDKQISPRDAGNYMWNTDRLVLYGKSTSLNLEPLIHSRIQLEYYLFKRNLGFIQFEDKWFAITSDWFVHDLLESTKKSELTVSLGYIEDIVRNKVKNIISSFRVAVKHEIPQTEYAVFSQDKIKEILGSV